MSIYLVERRGTTCAAAEVHQRVLHICARGVLCRSTLISAPQSEKMCTSLNTRASSTFFFVQGIPEEWHLGRLVFGAAARKMLTSSSTGVSSTSSSRVAPGNGISVDLYLAPHPARCVYELVHKSVFHVLLAHVLLCAERDATFLRVVVAADVLPPVALEGWGWG